jgi:hypothetical protein
MTKATTIGTTLAAGTLVLLGLAVFRVFDLGPQRSARAAPPGEPPAAPAIPPPARTHGAPASSDGFLYGRIRAVDGTAYEGRLRWGAGQEAFWSDSFNGYKHENPWVGFVPEEHRLEEHRPFEIFGIPFGNGELPYARQFMVRFGDLRRVEIGRRNVRVTLKSGTEWNLSRYSANELDDGVRVWDRDRGVVDLTAAVETEWFARDRDRRIRTIEFLPTPPLAAAPYRLHGTVRTRQGDFTGFVQWDRDDSVGSDELEGRLAGKKVGLRFDTIRSIARESAEGARVTLLDGRELVLGKDREVGPDIRGIYVDDPRYGRVAIGWSAFQRLDLTTGGSGLGYADIPPGRPLLGSVTTRDGRRLAGRVVYDLDESETTDTLDAESQGIHYSIPFDLIAAVEPLPRDAGGAHRVKVLLHGGEELQLGGSDDVGRREGSVLVLTGPGDSAEYLPWDQVQRIELERPAGPPPPLL